VGQLRVAPEYEKQILETCKTSKAQASCSKFFGRKDQVAFSALLFIGAKERTREQKKEKENALNATCEERGEKRIT
jgi:hypothetical protein